MNDTVKVFQVDPFNLIMQFDTRHHKPNDIVKRGNFITQYTVGSDSNNIIIELDRPPAYDGDLTLNDFCFSVTTQRLLMYIIEMFALNQKNEFDFSIKEYMLRCELEDRKHIRKQLERDLFALSAVRFYHNGKQFYILEKFSIHHKRVYLELHYSITDEIQLHNNYILLPLNYYKINVQRFHAAPGLLHYMLLLRYMNCKKSNKNRASIKSLLARGHFPSIEEVRATKNNNIKGRITDPFFRTITALKSMVTLKYYNQRKEELTEQEVRALEYDDMVKIVAHFVWAHEQNK